MISFIKGILIHTSPMKAVVDVHGIGYAVNIPANIFNNLPPVQSEVLLHTSFVIREFSQALYGFLSAQDRDLFEVLLDISGIGPKLALSLVSHLTPGELHAAVTNKEISSLCRVPGIGKKTAERLIIELRDKLSPFVPHHASDYAIPAAASRRDQHISDAMRALINLGYTQVAAQKAIKHSLKDFPEEINVAALITTSLKHI